VDQELELKCQKQQKQGNNVLKTTPVGGADGQSSTVLCIPKGMHGCPRVRDNTTAVSHYEVDDYRIGNIIL